MSDFKTKYAELAKQKQQLQEELELAKLEAIQYIQEIITDFGITKDELSFADEGCYHPMATKTRKPSPIKYRLPNGAEWTGKGVMKKEVKQYLDEHGLTREDLEQFLTEQFKK